MNNKVLLIVLDGFGIAPIGPGNAIYMAQPTNINTILRIYPNTQLEASGEAVGLPSKEAGTSEVGHINIGAGKIVYQSLPRINLSIADGSLYKNEAILSAFAHIARTGGKLHLLGLVGELYVHSSIEHLYALLHLCKQQNLQEVYIHTITDGRDSPPKASSIYLRNLDSVIRQLQLGRIVTIMGRYYAMDRDRRWERTEKAYKCLTNTEGPTVSSWETLIEKVYREGITDEFIEPTHVVKEGESPVIVQEGDAVIFYNFRIDRPRQLTKAFVLDDFERDANITSYDPYATKYTAQHKHEVKILNPPFPRGQKISNICFVTMTEYERNLPALVAFPPHIIKMPLGRVLSDKGIFQARIAESEKERFVTYYFNGLRETPFPFEERFIVPSPKVPTYDQKPEMASHDVTNTLIAKMQEMKYPFIFANYAQPDMVGHTGNFQAGIEAIKATDECMRRIEDASLQYGYTTIITADHGNIEEMINPDSGSPSTEHSCYPVPFIVIDKRLKGQFVKLQSGILADVATTVLFVMGIPKPPNMTGRNLLDEIASKFV